MRKDIECAVLRSNVSQAFATDNLLMFSRRAIVPGEFWEDKHNKFVTVHKNQSFLKINKEIRQNSLLCPK